MIISNYIRLCWHARYDDLGNRENMRNFVLPWLIKEADELEECRLACEPNPAWRDVWVDRGMLTEEVTIRQAIAAAEKRLAAAA